MMSPTPGLRNANGRPPKGVPPACSGPDPLVRQVSRSSQVRTSLFNMPCSSSRMVSRGSCSLPELLSRRPSSSSVRHAFAEGEVIIGQLAVFLLHAAFDHVPVGFQFFSVHGLLVLCWFNFGPSGSGTLGECGEHPVAFLQVADVAFTRSSVLLSPCAHRAIQGAE